MLVSFENHAIIHSKRRERQVCWYEKNPNQLLLCSVNWAECRNSTHTSHPPRWVPSSIKPVKPPTSSRNFSASDDLPAATHWKVAFWPAFISSSPSLEKCGALSKDRHRDNNLVSKYNRFWHSRHNNWQCFRSFLLVTFKQINKSFKFFILFFIFIEKLFFL